MMDPTTLGVFIAETFIPFLPFISGGVIAFILIIMFLVMFRGFMPEDE
jgi:hypothetical protein